MTVKERLDILWQRHSAYNNKHGLHYTNENKHTKEARLIEAKLSQAALPYINEYSDGLTSVSGLHMQLTYLLNKNYRDI